MELDYDRNRQRRAMPRTFVAMEHRRPVYPRARNTKGVLSPFYMREVQNMAKNGFATTFHIFLQLLEVPISLVLLRRLLRPGRTSLSIIRSDDVDDIDRRM